jgi:hypothetical protein
MSNIHNRFAYALVRLLSVTKPTKVAITAKP